MCYLHVRTCDRSDPFCRDVLSVDETTRLMCLFFENERDMFLFNEIIYTCRLHTAYVCSTYGYDCYNV